MNNLQLIDEVKLNRILRKHYNDGFIIITNFRGERDNKENVNGFNELKNIVKNHEFSYIPVFGGYVENMGTEEERQVHEPALLVPNQIVGSAKSYDEDTRLFQLGVNLANKYNQDSFLYKPKGSNNAYYIDKNGKVDMKFTDKTVNDLTQIYFTDLHKPSKKPAKSLNKADRRFTFIESIYLAPSPTDLNEAKGRYGEQFFNLK